MLAEKCVDGIKANKKRCEELVEQSLAMVTSLAPVIGYDQSTKLAKEAFHTGKTIRQLPVQSIAARIAGIAPFQTADGIKAGWIIVIEDVTDRASLEEQLRVSENEISGAFQNITSDFIANLKIILNNVNLNFSEQYFLGIRVGTDSEMSPRLNLTSSPYAYMAQNVSVGGIIFDSNIDAGTRNFTTTGTGFFGCAPAS